MRASSCYVPAQVRGAMKFLVSVLLLAACAAASASERKLSQDAGSETVRARFLPLLPTPAFS